MGITASLLSLSIVNTNMGLQYPSDHTPTQAVRLALGYIQLQEYDIFM